MGNIRNMLKMILVFVFVGWIFIWIMISTKVYKYNWTPKLAKYFNTSYFGPQGWLMLLFLLFLFFLFLNLFSCNFKNFLLTHVILCICRHKSCASYNSNDVHCGYELCLFAYPEETN